jgi:hypothetical protein
MMVVVVNEVLHGGWLEFLTRVKYDKEKQFDMAEEKKKEYERKREQDGRGRNKTEETCFLLYMSERLPRMQPSFVCCNCASDSRSCRGASPYRHSSLSRRIVRPARRQAGHSSRFWQHTAAHILPLLGFELRILLSRLIVLPAWQGILLVSGSTLLRMFHRLLGFEQHVWRLGIVRVVQGGHVQ